MIIATNNKGLRPGQAFRSDFFIGGDEDRHRVATDHPFLVIRVATFAEYIEDHKDEMDTTGWADVPWVSYYEVVTD